MMGSSNALRLLGQGTRLTDDASRPRHFVPRPRRVRRQQAGHHAGAPTAAVVGAAAHRALAAHGAAGAAARAEEASRARDPYMIRWTFLAAVTLAACGDDGG